jgi:predicted ATPase/class 3 adenylate cyclase
VTELPSGTVSLLFSDIEGSTVLLSRLGPAYAQALSGQRQVLRRAWAAHGGTELGTEGDSFFVVFPTAEGAVAAAIQAQRELAAFEWPGGEAVRVRMGVHTGTPQVHDGGYIGMDVHRAARIAGSAHGGQVLLSAATSELVGAWLPEAVTLKDLGSHRLKDIPKPEHLLQLVVDGLPAEFPPVRTLGAATSLPRPATRLVGRDGELAELTSLLGLPGVRLVTLTGPGGSGKTRLAIAVAERLVARFPDGVFFVPLAAVNTLHVMWSSIAEVLEVPLEGRMPSGLFEQVAHRSALFVLDNLEQVEDSDVVVGELLEAAPDAVVIATSRRPLMVPGEHVHPVPPLELPDVVDPHQAASSGAVQLFVQHARMVGPRFALSAGNTADVVEICRRLDGLPLAIELAAARTRLLSPAALLARLDKALDIAATAKHAVTRQRTLRDTIAWSYDLLSADQQTFFRRLGIFAGAADLDAIEAVTANMLDGADPLDLVAELVDASLVTVREGAGGAPLVAMLETIRAFAREQLRQAGEFDQTARSHAEHYHSVVRELLAEDVAGRIDQSLAARTRFEAEHDNVREALTWALGPDDSPPPAPHRVELGLRLCADLTTFWMRSEYLAEARRRLERAVGVAADQDNPEMGRCLERLANVAFLLGDPEHARVAATRAISIFRRSGDKKQLSRVLSWLGRTQAELGERESARSAFEEAAHLSIEVGDPALHADILSDLSMFEAYEGNLERCLELDTIALGLYEQRGDERRALRLRHNIACTLRELGRVDEAERQMRYQMPQHLQVADPTGLIVIAEDYGAVLAELGRHTDAARLLGLADATRERNGTPRPPSQENEIREPFTRARAALAPDIWEREYRLGRNMTVDDALAENAGADTTP